MEKKRLFKILARADAAIIARLAKELKLTHSFTMVKEPNKTLAMDLEPTGGGAFLKEYKDGEKSIWNTSAAEKRMIKNNLMGMVYQNPVMGLRMEFTSAANIAEKIIAAGSRNAGQMIDRASNLLQAVEILPARMKEAPKYFSGGMQQRVQISKALANNPAILLLDEVTTGLDLSVQAKVLDLIRKIKAMYGISILLVSHDLAVIRMPTICRI